MCIVFSFQALFFHFILIGAYIFKTVSESVLVHTGDHHMQAYTRIIPNVIEVFKSSTEGTVASISFVYH